MKKTMISLALAVALTASAQPLTAKSARTPVAFWEVSCLTDPGVEWVEEGVLHGRGRTVQAVLYDPATFAISGSDTVVSNINLDLATGQGVLFGTWSAVYLPESTTGTFDGTWTGKIAFTPTGVSASGRAVSQGTGELRGMKMRLALSSAAPPAGLLAVLATANPCHPDPPTSIGYDEGYVLKPRGE